MRNQNSIYSLIALLTLAFMSAFNPQQASAFSTDVYSQSSVLSTGRWIKISVQTTGVHFISNSSLRSWGFSNPDAVSIHGYGGQRMSDRLTESAYIDDLPRVQVLRTQQGIYFYAMGPETWTRLSSGNYYHSLNPYSSVGYYFITDSRSGEADREMPVEGFESVTSTPVTTFTERLFHETDLSSPGQTGHLLVGEDFRGNRSRTFNFDFTDRADNPEAWMRVSFVAASGQRSTLAYSVNSTPLTQTTAIAPVNEYTHATRTIFSSAIKAETDRVAIGLTYTPQGIPTSANLDAISVNYNRRIALRSGSLSFRANRPSVTLAGGTASTNVWDVTDPLAIKAIRTIASSDGTLSWTNTYSGQREYVAFDNGASIPSPRYVAAVDNQDLHALSAAESPDMIIITTRDWAGEAERLANFHRNNPDDPLKVTVTVQDLIYNEFGSGIADVNALRRYLKMVYDRGNEAGHPLRYVMLFGRATFDHRLLTDEMKALRQPHIPCWQSDDGVSKTSSYASDDIMAMLEDNSGAQSSSSKLSVAIGRAPIHSLTDAKTFVDKVIAYSRNTYPTDWKNQVLLMADNGDSGVFLKDAERQYTNLMASDPNLFFTKVYIDAFNIIGGQCTGGRQRLHRKIDEGILWWTYVGHGAINTLAEENVMSNTDINNMYNRRWPVFFAATCTFARHDGPQLCGAETMLLNPTAGVIAAIAPTRESMISHNGTITAAFGQKAFERDADGRLYTIGQIVQRSKNHMLTTASSDANNQKLYYVLLGDPALRLAMPEPVVELQQINGQDVTEDNQCTIMARQQVTVTGALYDPQGNLMDDFNGTINLTLYDAEYSTTSLGAATGGGKPTQGEAITFEEQGAKLCVTRDSVSGGRFTATLNMPSEIADNFRPAALNMYAVASDGRQATGCNRQLYVYGYDDSADPDNTPPVIEYAYLNHESFTPGATVNEQPMFIAGVSDDIAINLSTAGIGHQMTIRLDDSRTLTDVAFYYTPAADGSPSGTIAYPMQDLDEGVHSLTFRVWDTSGNSATHTIPFFVQQGAAPTIFDIYTDVNPARTEANFYLQHNRPDATLTVTLDIYDIAGRRVWSSTVTDRSDMFLSAPIHWDLTDLAGRRVPRGIYIYRATVTTPDHTVYSKAKRIAVAAP